MGTTAVCSSDQLITCDAQGNQVSATPCSLGCNAGEARCNKVDPSNALAAFLDEAAGAPELTLTGAATIDTDAGTITDGSGPRTPPTSTLQNGLPIGVFVIKARTFTAEAVTVVGARAIAIVSAGPMTLRGGFSVNARLDANGPGALPNDNACLGKNGASNVNGSSGGGGGGGFGTIDDRRSAVPQLGVACFDCHANGHTNAGTHLVGDIRPQEHRNRIDTPSLRGVNIQQIEFFNLVLELELTSQEKADLLAFLLVL